MPTASRTIYYLEKLEGYAEAVPQGFAVPFDPSVVIYKGVYLNQSAISPEGLRNGRLQLSQIPALTLLRPVQSSDGPPGWSAIVYSHAGEGNVEAYGDARFAYQRGAGKSEHAQCYCAVLASGTSPWETDVSAGRSGYFLTGESGLNALWRITRIQSDALNRQILTFTPVQLTATLAIPTFETVGRPLREYLTQHFEGFQQAITRNASFDAIDRANNLAEGILSHCLTEAGAITPDTLSKRLEEAKAILEDSARRKGFNLTQYAYHLAHQIRILHQRLHENQSVGGGKIVRPEVGLNLTVTVSELLVEVGLGKY